MVVRPQAVTAEDLFKMLDNALQGLSIKEISAEKCLKLVGIGTDLKAFCSFDDAGVRPFRASGSRWMAHKQNAMKRVVLKFGTYTNHLAALSEDKSVKPANRAKLKGYYNKRTDAKYLLGCA